jgi:hypothetical protein
LHQLLDVLALPVRDELQPVFDARRLLLTDCRLVAKIKFLAARKDVNHLRQQRVEVGRKQPESFQAQQVVDSDLIAD